ncbi:MAG: CBS domain-containing protein [Oscillospiraceae bacterium]|nr:CBS domain-containing protein [Oscillospiraceae bacterium]
MNIAKLLTPKCDVVYINAEDTIKAGMQKLRSCGYSSIPVISKDGTYAGSVSEGDFLWYITDSNGKDLSVSALWDRPVSEAVNPGRNTPVSITASAYEVAQKALGQNFIPVIDDRGAFVGIVTRKTLIGYLLSHPADI